MAENNLSPDSNSIKSDEVYLSETEKNITICESIDETLEDNKTSNEKNVSNVSQENLSWKGNEKIHKIADKEQKLSDFLNFLKSTEHPIQGPENKPCLLESLPENVQQCKERKCEMSQSLESNVEKKCTTETEESITDTGKNEKDSGSKSVERIEHPSQNHGNDTRFLEPLLEKTQPCKGKEFEMSTSIELNVDKTSTKSTDLKSAQTNCEVNNRPFRFTKAEQFIGDSCAASPFSVNKVQCAIGLPVGKRLPEREIKMVAKSATCVLNETVYCTNHGLPFRYWCHQCNAAKCDICVNVVHSRTCANHLVITMSEHVAKREVCKYFVLSLHKDALLVVQILRCI